MTHRLWCRNVSKWVWHHVLHKLPLKESYTCPLITRCLAFGKHFLILLPPLHLMKFLVQKFPRPWDLYYFSHTENRFLTVVFAKLLFFYFLCRKLKILYIFKFIDSSFFNLKIIFLCVMIKLPINPSLYILMVSMGLLWWLTRQIS